MKIRKSPGRYGSDQYNPYAVQIPTIRRCGYNLWLNAAARDILGDPDYISADYDDKSQKVTLAPSTDSNDFKVTKTYAGRSFSCTLLINMMNIQANERRIIQSDGNRLLLDVYVKERR